MKVFWLQIAGLLILIFGALFLTANQGVLSSLPFFGNSGDSTTIPAGASQLKIVGNQDSTQVKATVNIEIASTPDKRAKGLGGRASLDSESGMLFIFEKRDQPRFWMKGMEIPLDFIWIDGDKVADLLPNVAPPQPGQADDTLPLLAPVVRIDKVLEVNAGYISQHNIVVGDKIQVITP